MSARLHVNKPLLRRSSLALNRINVHVGSRKGSGNSVNGNSMRGGGSNGDLSGQNSEGNAFEELRMFIKQVSLFEDHQYYYNNFIDYKVVFSSIFTLKTFMI